MDDRAFLLSLGKGAAARRTGEVWARAGICRGYRFRWKFQGELHGIRACFFRSFPNIGYAIVKNT